MKKTLNDRFAVGSDVMVGASKAVGTVVAHGDGKGDLRQITVSFGSYEKIYDQYYLVPYSKVESGALDAFSERSEELAEHINKICAKFNLPKVECCDDNNIVDSVYKLRLTPTVSYRKSIGGYIEYCCWEMSISNVIVRDYGWDDTLHIFDKCNENMTSVFNVAKIYVAKLAEIAIDDAVSKEIR